VAESKTAPYFKALPTRPQPLSRAWSWPSLAFGNLVLTGLILDLAGHFLANGSEATSSNVQGSGIPLHTFRISLGICEKAAENGILSTTPQTREPRRFKLV
jgi:hypothetical protein